MSQIDMQMLMNDFRKFYRSRPWDPDPIKWKWAQKLTIQQNAPFLHASVMSYDEAVKSAERSKSPGYPWNKHFKTKGEVYDDPFANQILRDTITHIMRTGDMKVRTFHQGSPKDEVRPLEKLMGDNPKVRVFMCCDILLYTVGIMLYRNQNDQFLKAWQTNNYSAVGSSLQYGLWDKIFRILTTGLTFEDALKEIFHSYDISAMEATLRSAVFEAIYKMRHSFLLIPPDLQLEYQNLINWYFTCLLYAYVIDPYGFLIMMFGGNPSGILNTLNDNGIALQLYKNYSLACNCQTYEELVEYAKTVFAKMLGDDSIIRNHKFITCFAEDIKPLGVDAKLECPPGTIITQKLANCSWRFSPKYGIMVPWANTEKMLANVFYNRKRNSWRLTYVKLQAIRFFTQVDPVLDYQVRVYIKFIEDNYSDHLRNEKVDEILTYDATIGQIKTQEELEFLMYGYRPESENIPHACIDWKNVETVPALSNIMIYFTQFAEVINEYQSDEDVVEENSIHQLDEFMQEDINYDTDPDENVSFMTTFTDNYIYYVEGLPFCVINGIDRRNTQNRQ